MSENNIYKVILCKDCINSKIENARPLQLGPGDEIHRPEIPYLHCELDIACADDGFCYHAIRKGFTLDKDENFGSDDLPRKVNVNVNGSGYWISGNDGIGEYAECSVCHNRLEPGEDYQVFDYKFCPECGAKMEREKSE